MSSVGFGGAVIELGDVNGDGDADIAITDERSQAQYYLGSARGPALVGALGGGVTSTDMGFVLAYNAIGDVDGDGRADVASFDDAGQAVGTAQILFGEADGVAAASHFALAPVSSPFTFFGAKAAALGDIDGDGYDDVVFSAFNGYTNEPVPTYVYRGGAHGLTSTPAAVLTGPPNTTWAALLSYKDFNAGDGYAGVHRGRAQQRRRRSPRCVAVFYGGPNGPIVPAQTYFCGGPEDLFAWELACNDRPPAHPKTVGSL